MTILTNRKVTHFNPGFSITDKPWIKWLILFTIMRR